MTQFTSKAALFMLLLAPCTAFGSIADVAGSVVNFPVTMIRGAAHMSMESVDCVADIYSKTFDAVVVAPVTAVAEFAEAHSQMLWRVASLASFAYAAKFARDRMMKHGSLCKR